MMCCVLHMILMQVLRAASEPELFHASKQALKIIRDFHERGGVEKHHFGWGLGMLQPTAAQGA
jgi:hypothetical protein